MEGERTYIAIDLKSFYASVECAARELDPLDTNLVVADRSRTSKTICLAVSPSLKSLGIPGRPRLFEVEQAVKKINAERLAKAPGHRFTGSSDSLAELKAHPELELTFITAVPRMALYMEVSSKIYGVYLKYIAPEDIHVYSVDEVFMDITEYLRTYDTTANAFTRKLINEVFSLTGITATGGIGSNLYLCKVAMDIEAKHIDADGVGVRIAELDEMSYRRNLWSHTPLTDFWRVGHGIAARLERYGIYTMGDIARCSVGSDSSPRNEELLYKLLGVNAELLIDHAWGWEPCTMADIKAYRPENNSLSAGQVLSEPYPVDKARIVVQEMADAMVMDMLSKHLVTDQMTLTLVYDVSSADAAPDLEIRRDWYGRNVPRHAHGSANLPSFTSSGKIIGDAVTEIYDRIADPRLMVRRIFLGAARIKDADDPEMVPEAVQMDLFSDYAEETPAMSDEESKKESDLQRSLLEIKNRFGKNAVLKGMSLREGATGRQRNEQIGGHKE